MTRHDRSEQVLEARDVVLETGEEVTALIECIDGRWHALLEGRPSGDLCPIPVRSVLGMPSRPCTTFDEAAPRDERDPLDEGDNLGESPDF